MTSNLSKIKPKLRTTGQVTGNFGKAKVRTNGNTNLGYTDKKDISPMTTCNEYINRLYDAMNTTTDDRLKNFCYTEIKKYLIQTNQWSNNS
jgi:hypothetical protein